MARIQPSTKTPSAVNGAQSTFMALSAMLARTPDAAPGTTVIFAPCRWFAEAASSLWPSVDLDARDEDRAQAPARTKVTKNRMQPSAISALSCMPSASLNSLAMREAIVEPGSKIEAERRLALPTTNVTAMVSPSARPRPEHDRADDADAGLREQHVANHLPGRAADAVGAFAQHGRDLVEHVARDRGDERDDHEGQDDAGRHDAGAGRHPRIKHRADDRDALDQLVQRHLNDSARSAARRRTAPTCRR